MQKILSLFIIPISFAVFLIGLDWGLPTEDRFRQVFDTEENFNEIQKEYQNKKNMGSLTGYEKTIHGRSNLAVSFPYAGDEHYVLDSIKNLNPWELKFDPCYYMYGGGFIYTEAVFLQVASWLKYFKIAQNFDYYKKNPGEVGRAYYVMRLAVVVFAVAGIFLTFSLTRKYFGGNAAFLSWIILLVMPLTHQTSHTAEPHIFVLPFFILSFYFCLNSISAGIKKNYFLSAIFAGITIGTQATSLYIVCPFLMSIYINIKNKRMGTQDALKFFMLYTGVSLLAFLFINPFYITNFTGMLADLNRGAGNQLVINFKSWATSQLSWLLIILFTATTIYGLFKFKTDKTIAMFMSCILPGIAVYFLTNYHMPYVYSAAALLTVLTAVMLLNTYRNLNRHVKTAYVLLLAALFIMFPLGRSVYYYLNFTSENRDEAGRWINQNIPSNTKIGVFYPPSLWDCVPFNYHKYKLVDYRKSGGMNTGLPKFIITSAQSTSLHSAISSLYEVKKMYMPRSLFGYHYKLKGEMQALIAKTTIIYSLR